MWEKNTLYQETKMKFKRRFFRNTQLCTVSSTITITVIRIISWWYHVISGCSQPTCLSCDLPQLPQLSAGSILSKNYVAIQILLLLLLLTALLQKIPETKRVTGDPLVSSQQNFWCRFRFLYTFWEKRVFISEIKRAMRDPMVSKQPDFQCRSDVWKHFWKMCNFSTILFCL